MPTVFASPVSAKEVPCGPAIICINTRQGRVMTNWNLRGLERAIIGCCAMALTAAAGLAQVSPGTVLHEQKISATSGNFSGRLSDGDGVSDLVAGASKDDDGGPDHEAVWVLFLSDGGQQCGDAVNYCVSTVNSTALPAAGPFARIALPCRARRPPRLPEAKCGLCPACLRAAP